tara:strand:+ start:3547 stop:4047 length:501 start_codon:yes stop_codon:yes gene_type:complete
MKKLVLGLFIFGLTTQVNAQTTELPETIISVNYKYMDATDDDHMPTHIQKLKDEVLSYNHKELSKLYDNEDEVYNVSFDIPQGKIVAAYDKNGKIIKTFEKYNNIRLPLVVMQAVAERFPNWQIVEDVYLIKYHNENDSLLKQYKIKIKNADKFLTLKTDEIGTFL